MAKRGRPSKKVMKRRKELKRKSQSLLIVAVGGLILFIIFAYYMMKQGVWPVFLCQILEKSHEKYCSRIFIRV